MLVENSVNIILIILLIYFSIPLFLIFPKNVFGYYRNIEDARDDAVSYYDEGSLLCSATTPLRVVDFVIKDNKIHVITFKCRDTLVGKKYAYSSTSISSSLEAVCSSQVRKFEENSKEIPWQDTQGSLISRENDTVAIYWSLLPSSYGITSSNIKKYPIDLEGKTFILHIKTEQ